MTIKETAKWILIVSLLIAILSSLFIFIMVVVLDNKEYKTIFTAWQFPMILAVFLDLFYVA
jgi:uncharacterized integral membrane protein